MSDAASNPTGIAIVGMAGRFPKARNLDAFWSNLCEGVEAVSFFSDDELADSGVAVPGGNPNFVRARAVLEEADLFDAAFFGMNPKEAELTDPQHRLFLECAWEALENANCDPNKFAGAIGVFAGMSTNTYLSHNLDIAPQLSIGINGELPAMVGNERDYLPTRVSYKLNLRGPSLNIQTACSTSLVAVGVACQHLLTYQCDMALAGAVSVSFPQKRGYLYQEGAITSPDGHCRPFDVNGAGTVAGEGVGVVALKRLEDALKDGDAIYAVIKGFATNNDGSLKIGYTAPSVEGQADVVAMAQAMASIAPETISYVEAHGTGTPLGDPIEIEGLTRAFRLGTNAKNFCAIGSVKSNIGHLDTAAGIAGLIKTALALHHKNIPPSLHFVSPNPKINFADSPFHVNQMTTEWKNGSTPRRAGVSSFGFGGTNAHVVLEEAPAAETSSVSRPVQLLLLSARTKTALQAAAKNLASHLTTHPQANLADVAYTLQTGRRAFEHRAILACHDATDAAQALTEFEARRVFTGAPEKENPPIVFMFPGQGAQHVNMGRQLYETEPVFRSTVDRCCKLLQPRLGLDLRTVLYPPLRSSPREEAHSDSGQLDQSLTSAATELTRTAITQPAMFVIEYALAQLWMSWGVQPAAMIGHSLGEYVAACVAGVFSLDDALTLIAARGRMMQSLPAGRMLAVRLPETEVKSLLGEHIALSAVNAAAACVVSGPSDAIESLQRQLAEGNVGCVALQTSHAFHSVMMEPILAPFAELVRGIKRQSPKIPFISNVTGTWITDAQAVDPAYWASHLRRTVRFADGLTELFKTDWVLLEVGPGQTLVGLARQHSAHKATTPAIASLARANAESPELEAMLNALGQLWISGVTPAWEGFHAEEKRCRVWLPTYPFERKRYWAEPAKGVAQTSESAVSRISKSAVAPQLPPPAALEVGATAGLTTCATARESQTRSRLRTLVSHLSGLDVAALDSKATFTQLGFDSLFLTQASVAIERDFGVRVAFRQLLEEFPTLDSLAEHIDRSLPAQTPPPVTPSGNGHVRFDTADPDTIALAPLTESQRELWFASQMSEAASCVYNECRLLHFRGPLQAEVLRSALRKLVARHEALRTTFATGGEVQRILRTNKVDVPLADWSPLATAERALRLDAAQIEEARQPFDLVRGPLIRARLIRLAGDHHVFVVTVHHLVCDGYSFGILLRDLGELYSTESRDDKSPLPTPLRFSHYVNLQTEREQSPAHVVDAQYWVDQFAAGAPVLELPTDQPRTSVWSFDGAREWRAFPPTLGEQLKRLSAERGGTLFTTLFAAYTLLLRRLSGQKEIVVGVPLADRALAGGETLVGHCVNFLPLRGTIEDEQPFTAHLAAMQKIFLDADEHGRYAFGSLLQKLNLARDPSRMPLVSATFNLERVAEGLKFAGVETELAGNAHSAASFDINFDVTDSPEGLELNCRYNASLFSAETIQRWLAHFQTLLEGIVADPQSRVCDLPWLTEAERRRILIEWNQTRADYPRDKCVHQLFEEAAARTPRATAVELEGTRLTYRELNERANRLAHYLQKLGVGPETIVAVCLDRSWEMIVALLGVLKAGGAYLPLDSTHPKERLALMLAEAHAPMVLTQDKFRALLPENGHTVIPNLKSQISNPTILCLDSREPEIARESQKNPVSEANAESLAYISFTSGSTGKPKGVCVPHRAVVRLVKNTNYASLTAKEVFLQLAPLAFDASTFEIWGALLNGARLVIFPAHAPSLAELGEFIQKRGVTTLWLTAGLFHQMIEEQSHALRGVRQLLAGGDVLSVPHVKRALEALPDCRLINGYGPTENTTFTCCHPITSASVKGRSIPIGRPIANTQVYVLNEDLQPVPIGVPGELYAGGAGLAHGYLNQPELTAEKFLPNPFSNDPRARLYRTGDLARWLPDGSIEFLGRMDAQVKIRGHRVELGEIETVLSRHPAVRECVVVARKHSSGDKQLTAYFASMDSAQPASEELREHLRRALPDYMIPSGFVRLQSLPLTASGKVDRKALPEPGETEMESRKQSVTFNDDLEKQLAEIWQDVLGLSRVGASDDFFEMGGHSLLALRLIARVETVFGKRIPVAAVFHARTVAQMANLLREKSQPPRATSIVEIQAQGSRPPLMLVHGAGGGMFWGYTALANHLGTDQPVYAFKSRGLDGGNELASIEELARQYVADLRAFQPRGPYCLGGYCFGGNVAYEMARALRAQGEPVGLLALINCMPPNSSYDRLHFNVAFCAKFLKNLIYWSNYVLHLKRGRREFLRWKLRAIRTKFLHKMRLSGTAPLDFDIEDFVDLSSQPEGRRSLWETHVHALFKHQPKPYAGRVTLFRTQGHSLLCSFDETFGWRDLAAGGVTVRIVSGAHETIMDEPNVHLLAEEFRKCLDESNAAAEPVSDLPASLQREQRLRVTGGIDEESMTDAKANVSQLNFVHQMFEAQVARTPGAPAVVFQNEQITYAELNRRADKVAEHLRTLGIGPDVPVGICLERSFEMVVGVLAILKAGGAYVPLDPAYPKERLKLMLENARVPVLLTQSSFRANLKFEIPDLKLLCVDEAEFRSASESSLSGDGFDESSGETIHRSPLAYIIHTSGSTGTPKGVAMPHRPLLNLVDWQLRNSRSGPGVRTLQFASLSFDVSFQEMFSTWCAGGTLVLVDEQLRRDPVALLRFVAEQKIERLFLPFIALQQLAEAFNEDTPAPSSLREIITAGEQLQITPKIVKLFESLPDCTLHNHYGPSESHVVTAFTLSGPPGQWPALPPIGRPISSARIYLLDEKRQLVAPGEAGEICIGGDCLARGYLHRPDLTAEKFVPDPFSDDPDGKLYQTGDLGRFQADGNIEFLGRIDHQVKIRGFRIELGEIEATLRQHPNIRDAVVIAREDQPGHKRLVAYFISRPGQTTTAKELRRFLGEKLPDYMMPSQFVPLESLPLTPSGKVDRKNLPAPAQERSVSEDFAAPRTPMEETLAGIWSDVLGVEHIGINDNFFDLGGHSLMAVQVVSRMRQAFQVEVPVAGVFESPTITLLAKGIEGGRWKDEAVLAPISCILRHGPLPLSYSQLRLWFIHLLEPENFAYNVPAALVLDGELDARVLEQCLNEMVRRHEILRTTFVEHEGEPSQVILPDLSLRLPVIELGEYADRDARAKSLIAEEAHRPFDLARGPLMRCTLLRLAARQHILMVVMHHIISDGWSLGILFEELARLYAGKMSAQPPLLSPLSIQYGDYALWQRDKSQEEIFEEQAALWKKTLAHAPASLKLPTDHSPVAELNSTGAHCSIALPSELAGAMERLNRRDQSTPFMTLLAALMVLLNKWTRETDIVVGTVSAGRTRRELENLIGCFMNFLPIRLAIQGSETGLDFLRRVKAAVLESQTRQDCPFEKIVEVVKPERYPGHNPIYNVGFLLQNFPPIAFATRQVTGRFMSVETDSALLDLRFIADETDAGYSLTCEYRTGLFERQTIEHLLASFSGVLETLIQKPETNVAEFTLTPGLVEQSQKRRTPTDTITVTATFTAEPLAEPLEFWLRELELRARIQFAPYNQIFQQLLDPASLLSLNPRGLNVVLVRMEDWAASGHEGDTVADFAQRIEKTLGDLISALRSAAGRSTTQFLLCLCPSAKALARDPRQADFFGRMHERIANELAASTNVRLIFPEQLAGLYPVDELYDPRGDELGHVPYTPAFFTALATMIARAFHSQKRPAPKVIVLDCDQTLWAGVCGEDGPDGVELRAPHRALQEFMRAQLDAGRLLCLCSKNSPEDVKAVFERHTEMPLKLAHFAATRINWMPKSENLKAMAQELNLGVESFVLVDDNPVECAEVQANCPGALALQLPVSPELIPQFLKHCWIFDQHSVTTEDKQRTDFYRQERERVQARTDSLSMSEFLAQLDLKVGIAELSQDDLPRVAQLTQRTNQFNCTTRRRTEAEIQELLSTENGRARHSVRADHSGSSGGALGVTRPAMSSECQTLTVSVSDRFGDYGLVGLIIYRSEKDALAVETLLLSCRALGRGVEHGMLAHLGNLAKAGGAAYIDVHFVSSTKNKPALDFLESVGGPFRQALNGGYVFRFPAEVAAKTSFTPANVTPEKLALTSPGKPAAQADTRSTFARWRWIALEANQVNKIQALIEAGAGMRKSSGCESARPNTDVERELCLIWQGLLRIERVGLRDDFFHLGGHSLLAVRLFAQIEQRLHVKLPIVTIFQSPTVEQLARVIDQRASQRPDEGLLPIQAKGDRPPLFLVHGAGGDVLWGYVNLSQHSDPDQPIYGIQACGAEEFSTLEEMAAHYVGKVRAFQPAGPYHLGGYCFGGNVAQEMARQLEARGENVALLALLDCAASNGSYEKFDWRRPTAALDFTRNIFYWLDDFLHLKPEQRRSLVRRKLRTLPRKLWSRISDRKSRVDFDLEEFIDVTQVSERETQLWNNHLGLLARHASKPYGGHITLLRTRSHPLVCSFENDLGWGRLATSVTIKKIPGSHEGIFMEPHVRCLARVLEQSLHASHQESPHEILAPALV